MSKRLLLFGLVLLSLSATVCPGQTDPDRFEFHSTAVGTTYVIEVVLPAGSAGSGLTYPVIYCTDWFVLGDYLQSLPKLMNMGRLTEPFVYVGISQPGDAGDWATARTRDFTPAHPTDDFTKEHLYASAIDLTGGAASFVSFLRDELIPHVESAYPVDPDRRGLLGYSFGGLLGIHVLTTEPELFQYYLLGSPSGWYNEFRPAFELEATPAKRFRSVKRVYLSVGQDESWDMLKGFGIVRDALAAKGVVEPRASTEIIHGAGHVGAMPISLYNGLRFLFASE